MKITNLLPFALAALVTTQSCNDNKKEETTAVTTETPAPVATVAKQARTEGVSTEVTTEQVPDSIRTSFTAKYPKAMKPVWVKYEPAESDDLNMDDEYYYVRYSNSGADYTSWYNNRGEWVKTSTKVPGDSRLPDAVNKTINAQYPGYTIEEISKENDKDMDMYEVKLNKGEAKAKLKILPDGTVFKRKN